MSDSDNKTYKIVKKFNRTKRLEGILDAAAETKYEGYKPQYIPVESIPSTNHILHDILQTVAAQSLRLKLKAAQGYGLEAEETKQLEQLNSIVMKIKADERAELSQKDLRDKVESMTDSQILEYAQEVLKLTDKKDTNGTK